MCECVSWAGIVERCALVYVRVLRDGIVFA